MWRATRTMEKVLDIYHRLQETGDVLLYHQFLRETNIASLGDDDRRRLWEWCSAREDPTDGKILTLIGYCYDRGIGCVGQVADKRKSVEYLEKAVELGNPLAMVWLGCFHYEYTPPHVCDPPPPSDEAMEKAISLYRRAADMGHVEAMKQLADAYDDGTEEGPSRSLQWYTKAAEAGHPQAMNELAVVSEGRGDLPGAIEWWRRRHRVQPEPHNLFQIARLLEKQGDKLTALRAYDTARVAYSRWTGPHNGRTRHEMAQCTRVINELLLIPDLQDRIMVMLDRLDETEAENRRLSDELDALKAHFIYRPGGPGYDEAHNDFARLATDGDVGAST